MLRKIIAVKGVGTFSGYGSKGDVTFRPFTALWGPNGVGKSTICDILRSLGANDAALILGRRSLGSGAEPEVELLFEAGKRIFRDGAWDTPGSPQVHVFDSCYIHENVFVGDYVEHDQKKNLYRVIVGEEGVTLAATVDELDERLREATKNAGAKRDVLKARLPDGMSVETYVALEADPEISDKIAAKEKEVSALQQAEAIGKRPLLSSVTVPKVPEDVDAILAMTLDGIGADAERLVREHVASTHAREAWLSEGLRLVRDEICPFCGQNAAETGILSSYRAFFSESYGALKERVSVRSKEVAASFGPAATQRLCTVIDRNVELGAEWAELVGAPWTATLDVGPLERAHDTLLNALQAKEATPLEPIAPIGGTAPLAEYDTLGGEVVAYNSLVSAFNAKAQEVRERAKSGNLQQANRDLLILRAQAARFQNSRDAECAAYRASVATREALDKEKAEAKKRLDEHASSILGSYQEAINRFLQKFGATFRIKQMERRYAGGTPSSSYVLDINNAQVELGDRKTSRSERSFRNTLSGGDRSALALAFFLAQVERDPHVATKIVVLDDPFTSQDRGRRLATQQEIRRLRTRAAQVIVLSHDDAFLTDCCSEVAAGDLKTLQLRRGLTGPMIEEWNLDAPRGQALQDRQRLKEFLAEGSGDASQLRGIARMIRPLLEAYLRGRFLGKFKENDWLGDMIGILRVNEDKLPEGPVLPQELGEINEFSKRYHHAQNPGADTEPIDETELRTYVERTLVVADGF
ncbi:MAG: AAA family ATPase [Acidobacteriota bacterium]